VGNAVGTSFTNRTSGVEVGGIAVNVGALGAIAFLPCSGRIGPQVPARNVIRIIEDIIATCFDVLILENISTSMKFMLFCTMIEIAPLKSPVDSTCLHGQI